MSDTDAKATLHLSFVGPLRNEDSLPTGATAWITASETDPIVVPLPVRHYDEVVKVEVPAGRVGVVLRTPNGRRGRHELLLAPGEVKSIEFGMRKHRKPDTGPDNSIDPLLIAPPTSPTKRPPIGQQVIDGGEWGIDFGNEPRIPTFTDESNGTETSHGLSWMNEIRKVNIILWPHLESRRLVRAVVNEKSASRRVNMFKAGPELIEMSVTKPFAFVVKLSAPYSSKVLFHRAPSTKEAVYFTVKPRRDGTMIPVDSEVRVAEDSVMPLLMFLSNGDVASARAHVGGFVQVAEGLLSQKFANYHLAVLGAYALLLLREAGPYETWIKTLYEHFPDLSDPGIIYATLLMRARPGAIAAWYDDARKALIEAAKRPIPMLTEGVNLMVEGLERLSSSRRAAGDEELGKALERASWIQTRARPDELFTALWMDKHELHEAILPMEFDKVGTLA